MDLNRLNVSSKLRNMWMFFPFFRFEFLRGLDEIGRDDAAKVLNCKHYFHSVACSCRGSGLTVDDAMFYDPVDGRNSAPG